MRAHRKLLVLAVVAAALAAPASATALQPVVHTTAQQIDGTDQFAWSCVARALPPITSYSLRCNGQTAVGVFPVATISGVSSGPPQVCWSGSFQYGTGFPPQWATYSGCREGEHLPA
jgi:hypothetical protein